MPPWSCTSGKDPSRYPCSYAKSLPSLVKMIVLIHHNALSSYASCSPCMVGCAGGSSLHDDDDDHLHHAQKNHTHGDDHYAQKNRTHDDDGDGHDAQKNLTHHNGQNNVTSYYLAEGSITCDDNHIASDSQYGYPHSQSDACNHRLANDDHAGNDEIRLQMLANDGQLNKALAMLLCFVTSPSDASYLCLLKACSKNKSLIQAKQIHEHIGQHRSQLSGLLGDYLVVTLATCGAAEVAYDLATTLPCRTVFSWSAIISAYADSDRGQEALLMLQKMQEEDIQPNNYTFVGLLKACGSLLDLEQGKKLHSDACKTGYMFDSFVGNTLVSMYAKCGAVLEAENVFEGLAQHDVVSWNAMLSTYTEQGDGLKALKAYEQMQRDGIHPDAHTFAIALQACITLTEKDESLTFPKEKFKGLCLEIGQALHADAHNMDFLSDTVIGNTLVTMYCKCGTISQAEGMFAMLRKRDVVSWNSMLSAYVEHEQAEKCLQLYRKMQEGGESPDQLTLIFALQACGILAEKEQAFMVEGQTKKGISLKLGQALHSDICRGGFASDVVIGNALVTMYGKCGTFVETEDLFNVLSHRDTVSWNALLSMYVEQGMGDKALRLYRNMQMQQVTFDDLTLVCVLQACSETGSLELCMQLHFDIVTVGYDGMSSMVTTLIHSYGSCASIANGQSIFDNHQQADIITWNALVASYAGKGQCLSALCIHDKAKLAGIQPVAASFTSALSACAHSGLVNEGVHYFISMKKDIGITASLKHFSTMVDLFGRAGAFKQVEDMLQNMPIQADSTMWLSLLGVCRTHGNIDLARQVFTEAVNLQPKHPTAYVLMSNIYNDAGLQDSAAEVEVSRQRQRAWKKSGWNRDEHGNTLEFRHEKLPRGIFLSHMLHDTSMRHVHP